jgi:DNA replication protein DnaC
LPSLNSSLEENKTALTYHPASGACPTCGFPPDEPGFVRSYSKGDPVSRAIPCPDCHGAKVTHASVRGQLEGDLAKKTFDNYTRTSDNQEAFDAALSFCADPTGLLTLWGEFGPGKTHLLAAIANRLRKRARYFTLPDLVSKYRESVGKSEVEQFYNRLCQIEVMIIDEVDKAHIEGWSREQSYRIFDYRYRNAEEKGLVMAMNQDPDSVNESLGYLFSRMKDDRFQVVYVGGGDARPKRSLLQKLGDLKKLSN